jgi:hypothetical protein
MKEHRFQFKDVAAIEGSPNWDALIARPSVLYEFIDYSDRRYFNFVTIDDVIYVP